MNGKAWIATVLSLVLFFTILPVEAWAEFAETVPVETKVQPSNSLGEIGGYLSGNRMAAAKIFEERKFTARNGFGFAAERGNNLADRLHGLDSSVVGDNNYLNGPDRKIINRDGSISWIQDKYYNSAAGSVKAAFDNDTGLYRYIDGDGRPMRLEVPSDQYDDAVKLMRSKIKEGLIPGVTNPDEASNLVRKGALSYKEAVNIARAGTIDSLKYDAKNGAVTAAYAMGIGFVMDYTCCRLNGMDFKAAVKNAGLNGLKTGSVVFATYVISSQLAKTGITRAFVPTATAIANALGDDVCKAVLTQAGMQAAGQSAARTTASMAKLLSRELVADGVLVLVLTTADVVDLFRGRISKAEMLKNLTVTIVTMGAGTAGYYGGVAIGTAVTPGVGTAVGGILGSVAAGSISAFAAESLIAPFYESDADEMFHIINDEFTKLCSEYLIDKEEGVRITEALQKQLASSSRTLKDMYASENRKDFARNLLEPLFAEEISHRPEIVLPTEEQLRYEMKTSLQGVVFIH